MEAKWPAFLELHLDETAAEDTDISPGCDLPEQLCGVWVGKVFLTGSCEHCDGRSSGVVGAHKTLLSTMSAANLVRHRELPAAWVCKG